MYLVFLERLIHFFKHFVFCWINTALAGVQEISFSQHLIHQIVQGLSQYETPLISQCMQLHSFIERVIIVLHHICVQISI